VGFFIEMQLILRHLALCALAFAIVTAIASMILTLLIFRRLRKLHPVLYASITALPFVLQKRQCIPRIFGDRDAASDGTLLTLARAYRRASLACIWSLAATFLLVAAGIDAAVLSHH
jgi:hypothetical protein